MKTGANPQDRVYIARRAAEGATAEAISRETGIELRVVQNFAQKVEQAPAAQEVAGKAPARKPRKPRKKADAPVVVAGAGFDAGFDGDFDGGE